MATIPCHQAANRRKWEFAGQRPIALLPTPWSWVMKWPESALCVFKTPALASNLPDSLRARRNRRGRESKKQNPNAHEIKQTRPCWPATPRAPPTPPPIPARPGGHAQGHQRSNQQIHAGELGNLSNRRLRSLRPISGLRPRSRRDRTTAQPQPHACSHRLQCENSNSGQCARAGRKSEDCRYLLLPVRSLFARLRRRPA